MRIAANITIWDEEEHSSSERVWLGVRIEFLWWRIFFRMSRSTTPGHLGYEGRPYLRFFLGSTTKHIRLITTSRTVVEVEGGSARQVTTYRWCWRLR